MADEQDQKEILLAVYQEYREHARHSESITESANNFMLAIAAAILTIITADDKLGVTCEAREYLSIGLIGLGLLGTIFSISYTMRYQRNRVRGNKIIETLDTLFFEDENEQNENQPITITRLKDEADEKLWFKTKNENQESETQKSENSFLKWVSQFLLDIGLFIA